MMENFWKGLKVFDYLQPWMLQQRPDVVETLGPQYPVGTVLLRSSAAKLLL